MIFLQNRAPICYKSSLRIRFWGVHYLPAVEITYRGWYIALG
jgi:hypothetical protein